MLVSNMCMSVLAYTHVCTHTRERERGRESRDKVHLSKTCPQKPPLIRHHLLSGYSVMNPVMNEIVALMIQSPIISIVS